MRIVLQRVSSAEVRADHGIVGRIENGLFLLAGFNHTDNEEILGWMMRKVIGLRIFEDSDGLMNRSLCDVGGQVLLVSQFTLYADVSKGKRPSFTGAARPELAESLYDRFGKIIEAEGIHTEYGQFGAKMQISLVNDGPVTIILERD
ncbi:D-aminoacyl-tRNA deacylase [Calditrichota bacterium]